MAVIEANIHVIALLAVLGIVYFILYRLVLSPIAHIPGPKLAGLTYWYEFYYDVILKGRYEFKIIEMHEKYGKSLHGPIQKPKTITDDDNSLLGPIVRINPHEVHVTDFDFFDTVYPGIKPGRKIHKSEFSTRIFGNPSSMISTVDHDIHRLKRQALNNSFSKQAIRRLEQTLYEHVESLCEQIQRSKESRSMLNLTHLIWGCMADIIMDTAFGVKLGSIKDEAAQENWQLLWRSLLSMGAWVKQFPLIGVVMRMLPEWFMAKIHPGFGSLSQLWAMLRKEIEEARRKNDDGELEKNDESKGVFFDLLLDSELPTSHKSIQALVDEGQTIAGAGSVTSAEALVFIIYHLIAKPGLVNRLQEELRSVMAGGNRPTLDDLEHLPYLTAVLKEGLRLTYGTTSRLPRIHTVDLVYKDSIVLPKGTAISMSAFNINTDPKYFVNPDEFNPDRWLNNTGLDKYLVAFNKGTRACLGPNLAWAELYLALAHMCAPDRFHYSLYDTDDSDVKYAHDWFVGMPKLATKGVRVKVT